MAILASGCIGVYGQTSEAPSLEAVAPNTNTEAEPVPVVEALNPDLPTQTATIAVNAELNHQVLEGFGAAVAWHHDLIVGSTPDGLYEFLFPELGLDILRFRNRFERKSGRDGNLQYEVEIFKRASLALGYPPKLMLSSWSPPAALKESGQERCYGNENCTLKKNAGEFVYQEFAEWWLRSLQHYKELGLSPTYVSIQNEPDFIPGDWEGCKFVPEETLQYPGYGKALAAVHARLASFEPRPKLLGPEVLGIHYERVPKYLAGLDSSQLDGLAHHIYESGSDGIWDWRDPGPDSFLDEMRSVRAATSLPTYQTEFNTDEDKGIDGGFETAWLIHHTLVTQGAVAFLYWDLIWTGNKGLVAMVGRTPKPRDHYYALRHYARFTDPGYVRVEALSSADTVLASGYLSPDGKQLTLVLLNTSQGLAEVNWDTAGFSAARANTYVTTFRPGNSRRWQEQPEAGAASLPLVLPARSVATVVLQQ